MIRLGFGFVSMNRHKKNHQKQVATCVILSGHNEDNITMQVFSLFNT